MLRSKMFDRPLIPIFLSLTGGILLSHEILPSCHGLMLPLFFILILSLLASLFSSSRLQLIFLLLTFFLTGVLLELKGHRQSQLTVLANQRKKATIEGIVLEPIKFTENMARIKVRVHRLFISGEIIRVNENILVRVYSHPSRFIPGDKIRFPGRLKPFENFNNPGSYDYKAAMKLKGFACQASVSDGRRIVPMGVGQLPFSRELLEKIQRPVRDFFDKKLDDRNFAILRALILGERQGINHTLREPFNKAGLGHVLAVSGLHIGLVAWIAFFLFKGILSTSYVLALKTDIRKLAAFLTCLPVFSYTCITGFQVSGQRAMIMVFAFLWSLILGREKEVWSTLALAGLVILAIDTQALFSISFQLSFTAVVGILWLTPVILNRIFPPLETVQRKKRLLNSLSAYFIGLIAVSLSATIFLLPITSFYFHRVSLVTIPANVTVVPILGLIVLPFGLLSAATFPLSPQLANFLLTFCEWGVHVIMEMIHFWSSLSWSNLWVLTPNFFEMFIFYAVVFFLFYLKRWPWAKIGIYVLVILILGDIAYWVHEVRFNGDLKVTFLDVGQANSALVEFPGGKKMLVDGGGFPGGHFDVGKMVVAPFLWHSKIGRIDYLVLSHPQADHMNGLRFIAKAFHPKEFWYNGDEVEKASFRELMTIIESKTIKKLIPADLLGTKNINGTEVSILYPEPGIRSSNVFGNGPSLNDNSLVLKISFKGTSFLFPGDLEGHGEEVLIAKAGRNIKSDVLLSPHHGSKTSSTKEFLRMVRPRICVISSGKGNFFGFPHQQTLERLQDIGCKVIRIDEAGAVQCRVGPHQLEITSFLENGNP